MHPCTLITIENIFQTKMTVYSNFNTLREAFNNGDVDLVEMRSQFKRLSVVKSLKKRFNKELKKSSAKKRFPKGQSTNVGTMLLALARENPGKYYFVGNRTKICETTRRNFSSEWGGMPVIPSGYWQSLREP